MGIKNKIFEGYTYFLTLTVVDWVDIFTRPVYKHIIVDALEYSQKYKGMKIYAWCLMSNHLHLIACANEGFHLSNILRDFKKFTSQIIIKEIKRNAEESRKNWMLKKFKINENNNYKFWRDGNEAKELESSYFFEQKLNYIHNNPVKAEIVQYPEDYLYSSARDYAGEKGLINIVKYE
jgi:REP element-mobilizing transposase RayT